MEDMKSALLRESGVPDMDTAMPGEEAQLCQDAIFKWAEMAKSFQFQPYWCWALPFSVPILENLP